MMKEITLYTRVYNTEKFLPRCLNSVISQTYKNFKHIVIDNGCTDGCTEMLRKYAEEYPWVQLIRYEKNRSGININEYIDTPYFCQLDSDDWLEEDFFERLLRIIKEEDADVVSTGCCFHEPNEYKITGKRCIEKRLVIPYNEFADYYTVYHQFFRTTWGKIYKTDVFKSIYKNNENFTLVYGSDTWATFQYIRNSRKICVDNSALYHYQLHNASTSYVWKPARTDADIFLYNDSKDFLLNFGEISQQNRLFIDTVYLNAITDTLNVIKKSGINCKEKLREYLRILSNPVTVDIYKNKNYVGVKNSKIAFLAESYNCRCFIKKENKSFDDILALIAPDCSSVVDFQTIKLIQNKAYFSEFINAFVDDNKNQVYKFILDFIKETKNEHLAQSIIRESQGNVLLRDIKSIDFLVEYSNIYYLILTNQNEAAVKLMTVYFSSDRKENESFLKLYISVAAITYSSKEFVIGNINLAIYYFNTNETQKCIDTISELSDMGVEDNEEIIRIKKALGI